MREEEGRRREEEGRRRVEMERGRGLEQGKRMVEEVNPYLMEEQEEEEEALVELKDRLEEINQEIIEKVII